MTTAYDSIRQARQILAELRDVPADVLAECIDADVNLSVACALLLEGRTVMPEPEAGYEERLARSGR